MQSNEIFSEILVYRILKLKLICGYESWLLWCLDNMQVSFLHGSSFPPFQRSHYFLNIYKLNMPFLQILMFFIQDYSGQYKNRQIINNKLLLIVLFGKLYKLYDHGVEKMGGRQTSMAGPKYIHITIIIFQQIIMFI